MGRWDAIIAQREMARDGKRKGRGKTHIDKMILFSGTNVDTNDIDLRPNVSSSSSNMQAVDGSSLVLPKHHLKMWCTEELRTTYTWV